MNPRTLLSGPSRLRPLLPQLPLQSSSLLSSRRYLLTFPHPDLDPSNGSTRLVIRTFDNIPSLVHAYAIIRAVESKLGASVLDLHIPKDLDSLKLGPTIFLTTLKPVKLDSPLLLEIASPKLSSESNFLGGPSLTDIQNVLNSSPAQTSTELTRSPTGKDTPLQFRVETQRKMTANQRRSGASKRRRYKQDGQEGLQILEQLQRFGGGFYGGFDGLAEKFSAVLSQTQPGSTTGTELSGGREGAAQMDSGAAAEQSEEAAVDVEQVLSSFEPTMSPSKDAQQEASRSVNPEPTVATSTLNGTQVQPQIPSASAPEAENLAQTQSQIPSGGLSKAQLARERLRESAIASAQRDLELKERKRREAEIAAAGQAEAAVAEAERKRLEEENAQTAASREDRKEGGFFGNVFGKKD